MRVREVGVAGAELMGLGKKLFDGEGLLSRDVVVCWGAGERWESWDRKLSCTPGRGGEREVCEVG